MPFELYKPKMSRIRAKISFKRRQQIVLQQKVVELDFEIRELRKNLEALRVKYKDFLSGGGSNASAIVSVEKPGNRQSE